MKKIIVLALVLVAVFTLGSSNAVALDNKYLEYDGDGFEDGDYTNDPSWTEEFTGGGSIEVQQKTALEGCCSLEMQTTGTTSNYLGLSHNISELEIGDTFQAKFIKTGDKDPLTYYRFEGENNNAGFRTVQSNLATITNKNVAVSDSNWNLGEQYTVKIRYEDSSTIKLSVYDNNGNLLGSATDNPSVSPSEVEKVAFFQRDSSDSVVSTFWDEITYSTEAEGYKLTVDSPDDSTYVSENIWLNGTASADSNISYSLDDGNFQEICSGCSSFSEQITVSEGSHTVDVRSLKYDDSNTNSTVTKSFTVQLPEQYSSPDGSKSLEIIEESKSFSSDNKVYLDLYREGDLITSTWIQLETGTGTLGSGDTTLSSSSIVESNPDYDIVELNITDSSLNEEFTSKVYIHNDGFWIKPGLYTGSSRELVDLNIYQHYYNDHEMLRNTGSISSNYEAPYGVGSLSGMSTNSEYSSSFAILENDYSMIGTQTKIGNWVSKMEKTSSQTVRFTDQDEGLSSTVSSDFFYSGASFVFANSTPKLRDSVDSMFGDVIDKKPEKDHRNGWVTWEWADYGGNTEQSIQEGFVDYGSSHGSAWHMVDVGWYGAKTDSLNTTDTSLYPNGISDFTNYAEQRNNSVMLWASINAIENTGENVWADVFNEDHGAEGAKVDYVFVESMDDNTDSITQGRKLNNVFQEAYQNGLTLNIHGGTSFYSEYRYPNIWLSEGVDGGEHEGATVESLTSVRIARAGMNGLDVAPFNLNLNYDHYPNQLPGSKVKTMADMLIAYDEFLLTSSQVSEFQDNPNSVDLLESLSQNTSIETRETVEFTAGESLSQLIETSNGNYYFVSESNTAKSFTFDLGSRLPSGEYEITEFYSSDSTTISKKTSTVDVGSGTSYTTEQTLSSQDGNILLVESTGDTIPPSSSDNWTNTGFVDKSEATVEITATDSGGSGVEDIYYRVNGGSYSVVQGSLATVTISSQGNNSLEYYAEDSAGNVEATNTEYVALESNSAPSAALTKNNSDPKTFETIKFNASGSTDSDGSISSYEWELGSNGLYDDATGVTATKEYIDDTSPGENKTVSVRITDNDDFIDEKTISFSIDNRQPSASFTTTTNNLELGVDASGSSDRDGTISELAWDWTNDGNYETVKEDSEKQGQFYNVSVVSTSNGNKYLLNGTQQKNIDLEKGVNHTFNLTSSVQGHPFHISTSSVGGNFKNIVTEGVTVTDGYNGGPHVAETGKLYYKPVAGQSGDLYYQCGIHANMGADISLSKHTFGDQTFTHTYNSEGVYNVKLRVTDDDGAVNTQVKTVTVQKPLNFERTVDEFNDSQLYDEGYYDSGVNLADGSFNFVGSNLQTIAADLESNFVTSPIEDKWQVGESITMTFDIQEVIQKPSSSRPNLQFAAILDGRHPQMKVGGYNSTHISVIITPKDNTVEDSERIYDLGGGEQPADTTVAITPIDQTASNDITFRYTVQRSDGTTVYNESFTNSYSESLGTASYIQLIHRGEDIPSVASGNSEYDIDSLSYEPYVQGNVAPEIGLVRFGNGVTSFQAGEQIGERLAIELNGLKDPDGNFKEADIVVKENGNQIFSTTVTQTGTVPLLDITEIKDAKYTVEGTLTDEKGKTNTFTESYTVQEKKPVINLGAPGDGQTLTFNLNQKNKKNVEFDFQIEDNNNFDGSYSILLNGSSIKTGSFTASEFNSDDELDVQTFADVSPGTYNHTLQVTNSETGNTFVSSGNLGQTTFTVEGAEATPTVNIDSPTDGETIFYNKNDRNDANVTVSGSVDTTFSGNADVLLDGATVAAFDFENGTTSFSESFTAANGSHNVKISLTSDTTGTVYNSSTRTFTVEGVDEVPPEITVTQPDLNADADRVDEAFDYNVSFDSEINGTGEIFLRHNNGSKIGIIQDNLDISPGVRTKPGSFTIPTQFRYVGTYEVVGQVTSNKGNVYDSKNTLFILPETSFRELQPNDTTVNTGGDSNATVTLSGVAEISADGTLQIQVKQPDDSGFNTVTTKQFTGFGKDRTYNVDAKFTDITYPEINGNRSTSNDYKYRVKYILDDETAKGVTEAYTSDSKSFRFSKEAEGVVSRTLKQATNFLTTAVPPVFGLLALGASIFLTARETDSNIAIIVVALIGSGILIRLGLFPFVDMITGLPGVLVLLGVLLYLANNMGEVIS